MIAAKRAYEPAGRADGYRVLIDRLWPRGVSKAKALPAFDAVWAASRRGHVIGMDYDLRVRRGFFGEGRNIGRPEVLLDIAREGSLDIPRFQRDVGSQEARAAVLECVGEACSDAVRALFERALVGVQP
jgi:predicted DsbA family dithiol-disulfide isomerase